MNKSARRLLPLLVCFATCASVFISSFGLVSFAGSGADTTLPENCVWYGDVNTDNLIDITDIVMIRSNIVGRTQFTDKQVRIGDIDSNGKVDIVDVIKIRKDILDTANLGIHEGYSSYGYIKFGTVTTDTDSEPESSSSVSETTVTVPDVYKDVKLEAEYSDMSGVYDTVTTASASNGMYVKVGNNISMGFTVPAYVASGNYDVTVVAKFEDGQTSNYVIDPNNNSLTLSGDSSSWTDNKYTMHLSAGASIFIATGDGNVSIDCIIINSAKIIGEITPTPSKTTTTTTTTTTPTSSSSSSSSTSSTTTTTKTTPTTTTDSAAEKGFYVKGTKLYDANDNEFIMRGINVPYAWFPSNNASSLKGIADLGANCVRVVLSDGSQYTKSTENNVNSIIKLCEKYNLVCVLEIHDYTGNNDGSKITNNAVNYWLAMKDLLNYHKDTVIVNIANEWLGNWNNQSNWSSTYQTAIRSLRSGGLETALMVDASGWGQEANSVVNYGQAVLSADNTGNTIFSIHMYSIAGKDATTVKNNINNTLNKGLCLCIGEFGHYQGGGDVDEATIMSYCQQKGVGWMAWSWKGNSGGDEVLDIALYWSGSTLTDWGNTVFNSTYGIKNTSKICSVFQQ